MAPKKSTKKTVAIDEPVAEVPPAQEDQIEQIEEVVAESSAPQEPVVTFLMGEPALDPLDGGEEDDEEDDDDDEMHDELVGVVGQMGQLLMTDEGEAITDVLAGIRDALDKQNKILFRGLTLLERRG